MVCGEARTSATRPQERCRAGERQIVVFLNVIKDTNTMRFSEFLEFDELYFNLMTNQYNNQIVLMELRNSMVKLLSYVSFIKS